MRMPSIVPLATSIARTLADDVISTPRIRHD